MSISTSVQNEQWAQIQAYQPPASQSGQAGGQRDGWDPTLGTSPSSGSTATAGSTSGTLSEGTSFALIAFGGWGNGPAASAQTAGKGSAASTSDGSSTTSATAGTADITQTGTAAASQLFTDLQSLLSAFTGSPTPPARNTGTSDPTATAANTVNSSVSGNTAGWNGGYGDAFQQQFALSAYASSTLAGADSAATPSLTSISV